MKKNWVFWTNIALAAVLSSGPDTCRGAPIGPPANTHTLSVEINPPDQTSGSVAGTVNSTSPDTRIDCERVRCDDDYVEGDIVVLQAKPNVGDGWHFDLWEDCLPANNPVCSVTMDADKTVTAFFSQTSAVRVTLTVQLSGSADGMVTDSVGGLNCNLKNGTQSGMCTKMMNQGTEDHLYISTQGGFSAMGCDALINGNVCVEKMSSDKTATINFTPHAATHILTVDLMGMTTSCMVTPPGGTCNGPGSCPFTVPEGNVTIDCPLSSGQSETWGTGQCDAVVNTSSDSKCTKDVTADTTVTGTVSSVPWIKITVIITGQGSVSDFESQLSCPPDCIGYIPSGAFDGLNAKAVAGWHFGYWSGDCSGTSSSYSFVSTLNDITCTANFLPNVYNLIAAVNPSGAGTVKSQTPYPPGIDCPANNCKEPLAFESSEQLTATAATGYKFVSWADDCSAAGSTNPYTVIMDWTRDETCTADFAQIVYTVTVTSTGTGATFSTNPATTMCPSPGTCTFMLPAGPADLIATHDSSHTATFTGPCDSTSSTPTKDTCHVNNLTMNTSFGATVTAYATLIVSATGTGTGTVTSAPAGINCPPTCSANFGYNSQVTLTAVAGANSVFVGWSGGGCSGTGTCVVTLSMDLDVTATFNLIPVPLTVMESGSGIGTVTSAPAGITCPTTCNANFNYNSQVTLTASAGLNSVFAGWTGEGCSGTGTCVVTMSQARNVTATFNAAPLVNLTVGVSGACVMTSTPSGLDCGNGNTSCSANFVQGSTVTLTVTVVAGHIFYGYGGDCSGTNPVFSFIINNPATCTASCSP